LPELVTAPDWISAFSAAIGVLIAGIAAWFGLRTFQHQKTSNDIALALSIFAEINRYWDRISSSDADQDYNYGQILVYFEIACALFNRKMLASDANAILGDHIVEVFSILQSTDSGREIIRKCRSSDTTFAELEKFGKKRFPQALKALAFADPE
jgi:hypothetical protein